MLEELQQRLDLLGDTMDRRLTAVESLVARLPVGPKSSAWAAEEGAEAKARFCAASAPSSVGGAAARALQRDVSELQLRLEAVQARLQVALGERLEALCGDLIVRQAGGFTKGRPAAVGCAAEAEIDSDVEEEAASWPAEDGRCWDWPLSRWEMKARLDQLEATIAEHDTLALRTENRRLRRLVRSSSGGGSEAGAARRPSEASPAAGVGHLVAQLRFGEASPARAGPAAGALKLGEASPAGPGLPASGLHFEVSPRMLQHCSTPARARGTPSKLSQGGGDCAGRSP